MLIRSSCTVYRATLRATAGVLSAFFLVAISAGSPPVASAEVFVLANGGRVEAQWLNEDDKPLKRYVLQTEQGRLELPLASVENVIKQSPWLAKYREFLPQVPNTVDGHWDMAERCRQVPELKKQREFHLEQILKLDPEHEKARHGLGYSRILGVWEKEAEWWKRQGYVKFNGNWRLRQDLKAELARDRRGEQEIQWRVRINQWRTNILRNRRHADSALQSLREIRDPRAAPALAEKLNGKRQDPRELKLLYIDILENLLTRTSALALTKRYMEDPDPHVRERCLAALKKNGANLAVPSLLKQLDSNDNLVVNRAAIGVGQLGNSSSILPLIDALITKHKRIRTSPGLSTGFDGQGGGGLNVGGRPKVEVLDVRNKDVLAALTAVTPDGVNFGFDRNRWRQWYVQTNTPVGVELRRSR